MTLGIHQYLGAHTNRWNAVMATAVLASVPAVVLLVVGRRRIAAGISAGAAR
ncbi:hypothetical protein ACH41H_29525 [Streptomyces sp. NPDC020800]|uniref:hypothetical protein n=1 Tax=Streptomyces sp. NPDC020800 TaxID=3365092 RepID=UPI0037A2446C